MDELRSKFEGHFANNIIMAAQLRHATFNTITNMYDSNRLPKTTVAFINGAWFMWQELHFTLPAKAKEGPFCVGDYIVDTVTTQLFRIIKIEGDEILTNYRFWVDQKYQRHAKPEEIKAGRGEYKPQTEASI